MAETPAALLDANVLIPLEPRDTLHRAVERKAFRVHWTEHILSETERNLVAKMLRGDEATRIVRAAWTLADMRSSFPDAIIEGYEYAATLMTNAPEDRHVAAAAYHANVPVIVPLNLWHFRPAPLAPFDLRAVHPDGFLLTLFDASPDVFVAILHEQVATRTRPQQTPDDVLNAVAHLTPRFAAALRDRLL